MRGDEGLDVIEPIENWVSPRLGIRFDLSGDELQLYRADGERFASYVEVAQRLEVALAQVEQERQRAEQECQRAERLAQRLRSLGIDPEQLD